MKGLELGARFSLPTNRLRYCGPAGAYPDLYEASLGRGDSDRVADALLHFEALEPYLGAIAGKHGLHPLDYGVVEAYWIGNHLLEGFTRADYSRILDDLGERGLPPSTVAHLRATLPPNPIPHHAFHVLFVGVGAVTGRVATTLDNMEKCRPSWARAVGLEDDVVLAEGQHLEVRDGRLALGKPTVVPRRYDASLFPDLAEGDWLAFHWGWATVVLDPEQRRWLEACTARALEATNGALTSLRAR